MKHTWEVAHHLKEISWTPGPYFKGIQGLAPADLSSPAAKPFVPYAQKSFSASQQSTHLKFRKNSCGTGERI